MLQTFALRRLAVGPVDLRLEDGECVALSGPSGAGKSVLLRMMADLDPHDGDAALDGAMCSAMPAPAWRRQVAYVPAEAGWWASHVHSHFDAGAQLPRRLPELGLPSDAADWPVLRLSTGERQRLALLRALTHLPRVLLLDEPCSGLDADSTARVEALLRAELKRGASILLVTHDPAQALRMATRRFRLQSGRLEPDSR
jgi:ABC-type multidrug transport system ATPase subunit